jgi:two-component system NtrC family sensor kinase
MSLNVLIVDDSLTVRMDLSETFEVAGFDPLLCANLAEARSALLTHDIALAVLDVMLPDGNGVDLLQEIRQNPQTCDLPILMLSSESEIRDRIRGLTTGANDYVGKPYNSNFVVARARELLRLTSEQEIDGRVAVLLIDDSQTFRTALSQALSNAGYRVIPAGNGEEGLKLAAAHRPAALIIDGVMAGMDGAAILRRVRLDAALRTLPCLMLTVSQDQTAELRALDAGADALVRKEESMEIIMARFSAMLRNSNTPSEAVPRLTSPKRILIIDDSPEYLDGISVALRDEGYDVIVAHCGEDAIEMLAVQNVDCILLDFVMPGLGGPQTCRRLKGSPTLRHAPLIVLAGEDEDGGLIEALNIGADDYLPKTSSVEVVRARIQAQIRRKQFEDERRHVREQYLKSEFDAAEARAARELAQTRAMLVEELKYKNDELEAFSYSVSHDLRAPLRSIDGFSQVLVDDCSSELGPEAQRYLGLIRSSVVRMSALIDDMMQLSQVGRAPLERRSVDLTTLATEAAHELGRLQPTVAVTWDIEPNLIVEADPGLMRILLNNLLGNAWKFSARKPQPHVEFKTQPAGPERVFYIRDNGAGFDMAHAAGLFQPFKRLHRESEFPGTGIGLATVQRIVSRHGGRVWAEGVAGQGATVFFALAGSPA